MIDDVTPENPWGIFQTWLEEATQSEPNDPTALCLATVGADGMPSARMVLLKDWDQRGFVFYTNSESRKGTQILAHPKAAMTFHWKSLRRSVRIEGTVTQVTDREADDYFQSRPRQSRIGAWASAQSRPLAGRFELEKKVAVYSARYAVGAVPRPDYWSGFRVRPLRIEFWQDGAFRLHDRLVYHVLDSDEKKGVTSWRTERLFP